MIGNERKWPSNVYRTYMILLTPLSVCGAIIEPPPTRRRSQSSGLVFILSTTIYTVRINLQMQVEKGRDQRKTNLEHPLDRLARLFHNFIINQFNSGWVSDRFFPWKWPRTERDICCCQLTATEGDAISGDLQVRRSKDAHRPANQPTYVMPN